METYQNFNNIEKTLLDAVKQVDAAKFKIAMSTIPYCNSYDLKDTIPSMTSESYLDRMKGEHDQLLIRISKLEKYLKNNVIAYDLLHEQLVFMKQYLRVLNQRIAVEISNNENQ